MPGGDFIQKTIGEFSDDDCMTMAAALSYYTVFSLPSALLIVIYVAGAVWGTAAVSGTIQSSIAGVIGPGAAHQVQVMVANAAKNTTGGIIATIMGIAGLAFAATGAFMQLQTSLNRAWSVKPDDQSGVRSFVKKRIVSFLTVVGIGIVVLIALGASTGFSALTRAVGLPIPGTLVYAGEVLVSFFVFAFLFGLVFKLVPDARIQWKDVQVGAMITALLFVIGKFLIGFYLAHSTSASVYGAAGSLALLLLWTYYSSIVFLLGAEATQVWVRRHGRRIEPKEGAVKVEEDEIAPAA